MSTQLVLGPVVFGGFEIPERINFGGAQRLAIHRLPGGVRVIDAMGRDDAEITWSGIFAGPDAATRARLLDLLRTTGGVLPLTWDSFLYSVVISRFEAQFNAPWWVPYRIACTVVEDEAQAIIEAGISLLASVTSDLLAAGAAGFDTSAPVAALGADGATTAGTAAQGSALASLQAAQSDCDTQLAAAGGGLASNDLGELAGTTGSMAQLANARGYLGRAAVNLGNASA
jgi:hypothetical protein